MKNAFTWENFDIKFLQAVLANPKTKFKPPFMVDDKGILLPYMDSITPIPTVAFVRTYRREIEEYFLNGSTHLVSIVNALAKANVKDIRMGNMEEMLDSVRKRRGGNMLYDLLLKELKRAGTGRAYDNVCDEYLFTRPMIADMKESVSGEYALFDYQQNAKDALKTHFFTDGNDKGILMMPTGSGKTRVATSFLLNDVIPKGYQVIWLTHRAMLIEQAGNSIFSASPILKETAPEKEKFKMICVSGSHASIKEAEQSDDVIVGGIQSLRKNLPFLKAIVRNKVMIVVDEMHHCIAPSYRAVIGEIQSLCKEVKLLGLTATPDRTDEKETPALLHMFDDTIIYNVKMSDLIAKGYLAQPEPVFVDTNIDMTSELTQEEEKYILKWKELSPEFIDRMAHMKERNELIVQHYLENREKYGKTLIFVLNAYHCISLCEALQEKGVKADYVYCAHKGNEEKIAKFKAGELDVLVNINVLTEGSDIPDIQTVFLTRPTSSDVLLMQCVGRGMRGKYCGGTETVNIVDFHDAWGRVQIWMNAYIVMAQDPGNIPKTKEYVKRKQSYIEWEMIRELLEEIKVRITGDFKAAGCVALPAGWYDVCDEDGNDTKVIFFESQLAGYKKFWENRERFMKNAEYSGEDALNDFFDGFGLLPSPYDLELIMDTARAEGRILHPFALENRKTVDASEIAKRIKEEQHRVQ